MAKSEWRDLGLPRYEPVSAEWVKAWKEWTASKLAGHVFDFDFTMAAVFYNPPAHLLRDDGKETIGYSLVVKDGVVAYLDGAIDDADSTVASEYDPIALRTWMNTADYIDWRAANPEKVEGKQRISTPRPEKLAAAKPLLDLIGGEGNIIREEFYSQRSLNMEA